MRGAIHISIGQYSHKGAKLRNDDSYGVVVPTGSMLANKGIAAAVADGLSVSEGAKEASETCVKSFLTDYYDTPSTWTARSAVGRVLSATNRWLNAQSQGRYHSDLDMASTFSGLVLKGGMAFIFHVGDSRIALVRNGILEPLTREHKISSEAGREFLSRAVGVSVDIDVDYRTLSIEQGDTFLFTTDGVHDHISNADCISRLAATAGDLDTAATDLVVQAQNAGSQDNLTCQIIRIDHIGDRDEQAYHRSLAELPFPPELELGMILDGYRVIRELHLSPRSQVYLAIDVETGEKVALKTPSANFSDDPTFLECFSREEWIGQTISCPHVVQTLAPKMPRRFLYTLVEYVEGQTLAQWMVDNPAPDLNQVRGILDQMIVGVRALHRKEIIHQDLKPDNIVIDRDGTVKIVDFGSVRILGLEEADPAHAPTHAMGTVSYSAPELVLGFKATRQSDLYSLAVIVYEMLTGNLPYGRGFSNDTSVKKAHYRLAHIKHPEIPHWVDGALQKALAVDPSRRYQALSEFAIDLRRPSSEFSQVDVPLIARNPVAFWQGLAGILGAIVFLLLFFRH